MSNAETNVWKFTIFSEPLVRNEFTYRKPHDVISVAWRFWEVTISEFHPQSYIIEGTQSWDLLLWSLEEGKGVKIYKGNSRTEPQNLQVAAWGHTTEWQNLGGGNAHTWTNIILLVKNFTAKFSWEDLTSHRETWGAFLGTPNMKKTFEQPHYPIMPD